MSQPDSHLLNLSWLVKMRWAAITGQALTILGVHAGLGIELPLVPLFSLIALEAGSNVGALLWLRRWEVRETTLLAVMALDVILLTGLLYFTGGPFNPFSFVYLVQIALAAVVLRPRWTWFLVGLSMAGSALLFVAYRPLEIPGPDHMTVHLRGMWVAFGVSAAFIVYFLFRITSALALRESELAAARSLAARHEKLAALATLAAGAAHELSTPLSTIAVAARELERALAAGAGASDARLIRDEVARCREILDRMAAHAGQSAGEGMAETTVTGLAEECVASLGAQPPIRVEVVAGESTVRVPAHALSQAVRALLKNAQDASPAGADVSFRARVEDETLRMEIEDRGSGMPAEVLSRAGEPFFTTKPAGHGMGLGLFLSRAVIERLHGTLRIDSAPGKGTRAVITVPVR
ncbi:MAG TPA: ATP-binding protein [bacterium]|nr:ATP-binding protein [bacterium]